MAGPRCTVCDSPARTQIEAAMAASSERSIAKRWGLSDSAIHRHKVKHVLPAVARAIARREDLSAESLLRKLQGYLGEAEDGIKIAKSVKDLPGLARCIKEARETAVYLGKTIGLWSDKPSTIIDARRQTVNIASLTTDELRSLARLAPAIDADFSSSSPSLQQRAALSSDVGAGPPEGL
jgi:hypothetical protein